MAETSMFDYVVIGGGSAGCAIAARLTEDPAISVLLVEAGKRDTNPWIHIPVGYYKNIDNPKFDWMFKTEPDPGLGGRTIKYPRGKILGGSSSINGLLYVRGQAEDFNTWRQLGNEGWSYDDVLPYFKRAEDQENGADEFHGIGGPLGVSNMRFDRPICDAFVKACIQAGIPENEDFNGKTQEGVGYYQTTTRNGRRCSAAQAYLKPAKGRQNLSIKTEVLVTKVVLKEGRAVAVEGLRGGAICQFSARREIILSAGAIGSPHILQLSGIGRGDWLKSVGVEVVHELPGVGGNLQDHMQAKNIYKTNVSTMNDEVQNPFGKVKMAWEYLTKRSGPMAMAASVAGFFARSLPELDRPDIQLNMQPLSADTPGEGLHKFSAFTGTTRQLRPRSRGEIRLKSKDPNDYPAIQMNYLESQFDQQVIVNALKLTRKVIQQPALKPFIDEEWCPGSDVQSDDEILQYARQTGYTTYHPVGTCKMGSDKSAVVDDHLRVHGIDGLRVADASIMPVITSGNTNAPSIMIGEKAADLIRE
jgi:choline dehydrogenase